MVCLGIAITVCSRKLGKKSLTATGKENYAQLYRQNALLREVGQSSLVQQCGSKLLLLTISALLFFKRIFDFGEIEYFQESSVDKSSQTTIFTHVSMNPEKNPLPEKVQGIISLGQCVQLNKQDTISCI